MIKVVIGLVFFIGMSIQAQAQQNHWQLIASPGVVEVTGDEAIATILASHPAVLRAHETEAAIRAQSHLSADPIVTIREMIGYHRWVGPHGCKPNDSRLIAVLHDYSIETAGGQNFIVVEGRAETDPCSKSLPRN